MMKNKYIDELNNIQADSAFKKQMIEKMNNQRKPIVDLSNFYVKAALICTCTCLIIISIFTYKTYQEMQLLKEQLASATNQIEKLYNQLNEKDLMNYMERNDETVSYGRIRYSNPYNLGGMGDGDIFIGEKLENIDLEDEILIDESFNYEQLPISYRTKHFFTIKEKKEILYNFIEEYQIKDYQFYVNDEYMTILSDQYSIEIKDEKVTIDVKNGFEINDIESFMNEFIRNHPILFKDEYEDMIITENPLDNKINIALYEMPDNDFDEINNSTDEIYVRITQTSSTKITIEYTDYEKNDLPCISYQEALDQLIDGKYYYQDGMKEYIDINNIYAVKLNYMFNMGSSSGNEAWLPYYQFLVGTKNLELLIEKGFEIDEGEYVISCYIPSIQLEDIEIADYEKDFIGGQ